MSAECYSSLNCLSPDGISDDDFAERPSFASGGEFFDDETHLESEGRVDDFKVDDLLMDSNWGDFLSAESKNLEEEESFSIRVFLGKDGEELSGDRSGDGIHNDNDKKRRTFGITTTIEEASDEMGEENYVGVGDDVVPPPIAAKKKNCSHEGCTNYARSKGLCFRHGAKVKSCSHEGCANFFQKGGVCKRHGAKTKRCSHEGCANGAVKGGVCVMHGAMVKRCSHVGCANLARDGVVCHRHGANVKKKRCSHEGCNKYAQSKGLCIRHGAIE